MLLLGLNLILIRVPEISGSVDFRLTHSKVFWPLTKPEWLVTTSNVLPDSIRIISTATISPK
jgi:hypothetical protein